MNSKQRYAEYLKTDYWKEVSSRVKARAGWKCQLCNSQHDLIAHHRTYEHRGKELDHLDDLTCICNRCHQVFHGIIEAPSNKHEFNRMKKLDQREKRKRRLPTTESLMPNGTGPIILTKQLVFNCSTGNHGGFTSATTLAFGLSGKLKSGWKKRLEGTTVSRDTYRKALDGRFIYAT